MQILLAARARSAEVPLYDVHILLQPCASMPDGPAEPVVLNAADLMVLASIESKITGWIGWGIGIYDAFCSGRLAQRVLAVQCFSDCGGVLDVWV